MFTFVDMAYPSEPASAAYHALEWIFGNVAKIRVLRVLALHRGQIAGPAIAELARLSRGGAWKALRQLSRSGIIKSVGAERAVLYQLDPSHPFSRLIIALFEAEQKRLQTFLRKIKSVARGLQPEILAVWVFGSVAREEDEPQSDLDLAVLVRSERSRRAAEVFREKAANAGKSVRIDPAVISLTLEDLRELPFSRPDFWESLERDAMVLIGQPPAIYLE